MSEDLNSYDELPYSARPFFDTHPDHLAATAILYGLDTVPLEKARVLELGCANGANLIPMASTIPTAKFVGIDLSPRQIEDGHRIVGELQLENIDLRAMSIMDIGRDFGEFDYIICHGVYSWVPPEVQTKILQIAHDNLSPLGLAYISYNTYPGWHIRAIAREMLNFHVRGHESVRDRVEHAQNFLEFLVNSLPNSQSPYAQLLQSEIEVLRGNDASYLAHEHLESFNQPVYFHQFMERATAAELQFVAEARPTRITERLSSEALQQFRDFSNNWIDFEQYIDFVNQRTFRRSIVCHTNRHIDRHPTVARLTKLRFCQIIAPAVENPDLSPEVEVTFRSADRSMTTNHPAAKALALVLFEREPEWLTMDELQADVRSRVEQWPGAAEDMPAILLRMVLAGLVSIHQWQAPAKLTPSDRPLATAHARMQSRQDLVTNLQHRSVQFEGLDRCVLGLLDGSRDHEQIGAELLTQIQSGKVKVSSDGTPLDPEALQAEVKKVVPESLARLAKLSMLIK